MSLFKEILSLPTAPFRERLVLDYLQSYLSAHSVPNFFDPVGNLVAGAASDADYRAKFQKKSSEPLRIFIAHCDHPGFHGVKWLSKERLSVKWLGGSPTKLIKGAKVWLADEGGYLGEGRFGAVKIRKGGGAIETGTVIVKKMQRTPVAEAIYGGFGFRQPMWRAGTKFFTKAADDLVGTVAIASLAVALKERSALDHFIGLLTRGEEVGWVGAIGHLQLPWREQKNRTAIWISLETSRTLAGAEIGKGPIVRLGDRSSIFDPAGTEVLHSVAKRVLGKNYQRRIMDGGSCEATAVTIWGERAIGISVPLGNYHNQSYEGGGGSRGKMGPAPEFVDARDVAGMYRLIEGLMDLNGPWEVPWKERREAVSTHFEKYRPLL